MKTSYSYEITELCSILEQNFEEKINKARLKLISMLILALCKVKNINYMSLACAFDSEASPESSMRRVQRFMANFDFPMKLVSCFIFRLLPEKQNLILVIDRTNWQFGNSNINILTLGVCYKNMAIPLIFKMLNKKGVSDTNERIDLINTFIRWFGADHIDCLLADREFIGHKWLDFLNKNHIKYYIRIRNNFKVFCFDNNEKKPVFRLFENLKKGEVYHHKNIVEINGIKCYVSGIKIVEKNGETGFLIIISLEKPKESLVYYQKRWQIETLFKALKSSGFNIEKTHVTDQKRLEKLFMIVMISLVWCYKIGDYLQEKIKPIKIKKHQRKSFSIFKYGLNYLNRILLTNKTLNINYLQFLSCT